MAYTQNPYLPRVRREAADMVRRGYTPNEVGRRYGVGSSTVCKWFKKAQVYGYRPIPTLSSRPKSHPNKISGQIERAIVRKRLARNRCAEVVHQELLNEGTRVSLSTVKRTLERHRLVKKRSPWKRYHPHVERPLPAYPGALVQFDTIHRMIDEKKRLYVYVAIDVCSRWAYAKTYGRMNGRTTLRFLAEAQARAPFSFEMLQSDHGPEFSGWFVSRAERSHRYTRIGKPNDNAHIERFNRTLQEECLDMIPTNVRKMNNAIRKYLPEYVERRLHLGLGLKTPQQYLTECVQGID
jgi:putative transposase